MYKPETEIIDAYRSIRSDKIADILEVGSKIRKAGLGTGILSILRWEP